MDSFFNIHEAFKIYINQIFPLVEFKIFIWNIFLSFLLFQNLVSVQNIAHI